MRTRRLHARLYVFVRTYQYRGCSDISMLVGDAPLKNARVSWPFCRGSGQPATPAVRKVSGTRQNPVTIAGNASTLYDLFARLKGSSDAHKATARTLVRLRASQSIARVQWHQHVRRRRPAKERARFLAVLQRKSPAGHAGRAKSIRRAPAPCSKSLTTRKR